MKWLIASDIHGSAYWCERLLQAFKTEQADRLLLLGDTLYHGPRNDLPEGYAPKEVFRMLNAYKDKIFAVRGNCDAEIDQQVLQFPMMADYCLISVGERLIFATHGHIYNDESLPPLSRGDVLLHGHTHVPRFEEKEGILFLNPGSAALPKNGSEHSFMLLDGKTLRLKSLSGGVTWEKEL